MICITNETDGHTWIIAREARPLPLCSNPTKDITHYTNTLGIVYKYVKDSLLHNLLFHNFNNNIAPLKKPKVGDQNGPFPLMTVLDFLASQGLQSQSVMIECVTTS